MNRRDFLNRAMIAAGLLVVDPDRLLWTPGKRTIFIPAVTQLKEPVNVTWYTYVIGKGAMAEWHPSPRAVFDYAIGAYE